MQSYRGWLRLDGGAGLVLRLVAGLTICACGAALADDCDDEIGRVVAAEGGVLRHGAAAEVRAAPGGAVCLDTLVRIQGAGRVTIELTDPAARQANDNRPIITLGPDSSLRFTRPVPERTWMLDLLEGWFRFFSPRPADIDVATPYVTAGVRGTEFVLHSQDGGCTETGEAEGCAVLWVQEGLVLARNDVDDIVVDAQDPASPRTLVARLGRELEVRELRITPEDAVNWVIHYLPLSRLRAPACPDDTGPGAADIGIALGCAPLAAITDALARIPADIPSERKARLYGLAARRLLTAGDPLRAAELIDTGLGIAPSASLHALESVIALKRNGKARARSAAEQAIALDPESPDAHLAMSYVQQAEFDLRAARASAQLAAGQAPGDPLLAARLAELELSLGDTAAALVEAEKAVAEALRGSVWTAQQLRACGQAALTPSGRRDAVLSRSLTTRGLSRLIRLQVDLAQADLQQAICADDQSPLARLGLGLALTRQGELDTGVRQFEIAAALDPRASLHRSYLGRGYLAQDRFDLAEKEFALAKAYDDRDPTPWLYDAIRKLLLNRPVEALADMRRSIALNENRAPYRSSQGLDEDLAAREIGLARIYRDLGFTQLATLEAAKALDVNPAEYSAHRLLADAYRGEPRLEVARASELLQAQLLQPLNANPIQPSLAFTDLGIRRTTGPATPGFNEYSPLFLRDGLRFSGTGLLGSDDTLGEEVVLSGMFGRAALSAGQFHYETDGWRSNSDLEHDIYNLFGQLSLTDGLDIQAEYRRRDSSSGDRSFDVEDPFGFFINRRDIEQEVVRLGAHLSLGANGDLIASVIDSDRRETVPREIPGFGPFDKTINDIDSKSFEVQYLRSQERMSFVLGGGSIDTQEKFRFENFLFALSSKGKEEIDAWNAYAYVTLRQLPGLTLTLGAAYEDYEQDADGSGYSFSKVLPKFGVAWQPAGGLTLRAAAFRSVKRDLAANQTIEPTNIAGFNQLTDEFNGSLIENYRAAADLDLDDALLGLEVGYRKSSLNDGSGESEYRERLGRAYAYWLPTRHVSVNVELVGSRFEQDDQLFLPSEIKTVRLPLGVQYRRPNGVFAGASLTWFTQEVTRDDFQRVERRDSAVLTDLAIGRRFAHGSGELRLEVKNLFDKEFGYQDDAFRTSDEQINPLFLPARTIMAMVQFNL